MHHEHLRIWAAASCQNTLAGLIRLQFPLDLALTLKDFLLNALKQCCIGLTSAITLSEQG